MAALLVVLVVMATASCASCQYYGSYYCQAGRDVMVHLFEWKWTDVAAECAWLAAHNFCAVQVSPPSEHRIVTDPPYPWWQRYQPVSYKMGSRSGTEAEFIQMVQTCNNQSVYIYVDAVINHMTGGGWGTGSDGSSFNADTLDYPGVPYGPNDFNPACDINDYNNPDEVRNCRLVGLRDLKTSSTYVRDQLLGYLNKLVDWGVAGFRIDASKHMWPGDISAIFSGIHNLNTQWFPAFRKPYIYMEVIDLGNEAISSSEYIHIGRVTEFRYGRDLGDVFRKNNGQQLSYLQNFGQGWGFVHGLDALVFIDNHDNQRGHGAGGSSILTFFNNSKLYKMATAFELAWQYGHVRLMSSYDWARNIVDGVDQNDWIGPPSDGAGNTESVVCFNGKWVCEHRWRQMYNMVTFHNVALNEPVSNWWDNGYQAIAFGRGNKAFIVINNEDFPLSQTLYTGLPAGEYCDVISCPLNRPGANGCHLGSPGECRGTVTVNSDGYATFNLPSAGGTDPMWAIHV